MGNTSHFLFSVFDKKRSERNIMIVYEQILFTTFRYLFKGEVQ